MNRARDVGACRVRRGLRAGDLGLVSQCRLSLLPSCPSPLTVLRANQALFFCFCRGSVPTAPPSICPIGSLDRGQSQRDRRASSEAQIGLLSGSAKSEPRVPTPMRDWGVPDWELGMDCAWRETDQRCWSLMPPCLPASCNLQPVTRRAQNAERTLNILGLHELASDSLDAALLPRRVAEFAMPVFCGSWERGTSGRPMVSTAAGIVVVMSANVSRSRERSDLSLNIPTCGTVSRPSPGPPVSSLPSLPNLDSDSTGRKPSHTQLRLSCVPYPLSCWSPCTK